MNFSRLLQKEKLSGMFGCILMAHRWPLLLLFFVAVFNAVLITRYPPAVTTDSIGYLAYADMIVQVFEAGEYGWLKTLHLEAGVESWAEYQWEKPDTYRMIGYPLVIAMTKLIAGDDFAIWLQVLQNLVVLVSAVFVYLVAMCVTRHKGWACLAALAYAFSPMIKVQNAILTDSLYSSLLVMALCMAVISFYRDDGFPRRSLMIGVFVALAFLVRDATTVLMAVFLPVFLAPLWFANVTKIRKTASAVLIFLPMITAYLGYGMWNYSRSDHFFMTLNHPVYGMFVKLEQGVPAFSYGQPIDVAANKVIRELNLQNGLPEGRLPSYALTGTNKFIGRFFEVMREEYGYDQYDMFVAIKDRSIRLMLDHPVAAIKFAFREMFLGNPNGFPPVVGMALSPLTEIALLEEVSLKKQPRSIMAVVRAIQSGNYTVLDVAEVGVRILFRLVPLGIFLLYLAFPAVWLIFMRSRGAKETVMMASIWVIFAGMSFVYSLFHFEVRYVLGALPSQIICAIVCAQFILDKILPKYRAGYSTKNA